METVLQDLITSLKKAATYFNGDGKETLHAALHNAETLPDKQLWSQATEALDLLEQLRLSLEPGHLVLADHFMGYMSTKALLAAVNLSIPDILSQSGPLTLPELARCSNAHPARLSQILRTLRNNGIFGYDALTKTYTNNHVSTLLLKNHWTQWGNWVTLYSSEFYDMARGIPSACQADAIRSPAQIEFDTDDSMFKYFTDQGWMPMFFKTLSGGAAAQAPGILADYPWEEVADTTVVDIGGGDGGLIALLLRAHPKMKGGILEIKSAITQARDNFYSEKGEYADVGNQVPAGNLVEGDFFNNVGPATDVYTIKWCLHNWDDEKTRVILRNIRMAIRRTHRSRLVVLESVISDGHMGRMSRYGDLNMMVTVGGRERDEQSWTRLALETGWEVRRIYPLRNAWPSAIEFRPVWDVPFPLTLVPKKRGEVSEQGKEVRVVRAEMQFLEPWDMAAKDGKNPFIRVAPAPGYERTNITWKGYTVSIQDARAVGKDKFMLDTHGFAYLDDEIPENLLEAIRGNDTEVVLETYCPHVEALAKRITGAAARVIVFDHTLRKKRRELDEKANEDGKEQPALMVHCDQSEKGALRRLKMNVSENEDIDELLRRRVEIINVWRPLNGPVQDWPLATMDFRTVDPAKEMFPCDLLKGENEERGQTATFTHSDGQKWYYLDNQTSSEVTVLKIWDSKGVGESMEGVASFCAHAAFWHPDAPADVEPRESVEVRCLVIH